MASRVDCLQSLLRYERPIRPVMDALTRFGFESPTELVTMTPGHIRDVMFRLISGDLNASKVEQWAEFIEAREDIGFEEAHHDLLSQTIFELANPSINYELTKTRAHCVLEALSVMF